MSIQCAKQQQKLVHKRWNISSLHFCLSTFAHYARAILSILTSANQPTHTHILELTN